MSEELIKAVQERPVLWSSKHPQHKAKHIVTKTWGEVKQLMPQYEVDELRRKWKNLKDNYRKEVKKAVKIGAAVGNGEYYESPWQYYNMMSFIRDQVLNGEQPSQPDARNATPDCDDESSDSSTTKDDFSFQTSTSRKRVLNASEMRTEYLEIEKKKLKMLEMEIAKNQNNDVPAKSEDYHFLMSLLPQMERLEPIQKLRVRNKFNEALMEELAALEIHENVTDAAFIKVEPFQ